MIQVLYEYETIWPESGTVTLDARLQGEIRVSPDQARRRANKFLALDVGVLIGADDPVLVWGEQPHWRLTANLYLPELGKVGSVGYLQVDATTGSVIPLPIEQIEKIQGCANDLRTTISGNHCVNESIH